MVPGKKTYRPASPEVLTELVKGSGVPVRELSQSYVFTCPRCLKADKLYMYKKDGRFVCWVCKETDGFQGRPEYALTEILGVPIGQLRKKLYGDETPQAVEFLDVRLRDFWADDEEIDEDAYELQRVLYPPDFWPITHPFAKKGREYLEGRGLSAEIATEYGIRYCPPMTRVIFPVGCSGEVYGWQARLIGQNEFEDPETGNITVTPKITTTKGLKKEQTFMFMDRLIGSEHAVICEGPMDAIKCHLLGGNVATMGKAVSKAQLEILRNLGIRKIYLGLDPDAATEIIRLCRELADLDVFLLEPPKPYKDLGEMPMEAVKELFAAAQPLVASRVFVFAIDDHERLDRLRIKRERRNARQRSAF